MYDILLKISELFLKNEDIPTDNFKIVYELESEDFELLEKDLYIKKNSNLKNFKKSEEMVLKLNDIVFIFNKK